MLIIDDARLMTSSDRRLNVHQIKNHYFFYGVDWNTIRQIDAPFVPHLRSVTDTSYFPTDELHQEIDNVPADPGAAGKDLAFLGSAKLNLEDISSLTVDLLDTHSNDLRLRRDVSCSMPGASVLICVFSDCNQKS